MAQIVFSSCYRLVRGHCYVLSVYDYIPEDTGMPILAVLSAHRADSTSQPFLLISNSTAHNLKVSRSSSQMAGVDSMIEHAESKA